MSEPMMTMPPEVDEHDPLTDSRATHDVVLVKRLGVTRPRNPNRCDECGRPWQAGIVKRYTIDGHHVRLCPICRGKVTI